MNIVQLHTERNNKSREAFDKAKLRELKLQHVKCGIKLWLNGELVVEMKSNIKIIIRKEGMYTSNIMHIYVISHKK